MNACVQTEVSIKDWAGITAEDHYGLTFESFCWFKLEGDRWVPFFRENGNRWGVIMRSAPAPRGRR